MNLELLRPFSLDAAQRGEEICWHTGVPVTFITSGPNGDCAYRSVDENIYLASSSHLRMRPLAWVEDRPVYKGDKLWHKVGVWITADKPAGKGCFIAADGDITSPSQCTWAKPEAKKTTRTVKFLAWMSHGQLVWYNEDRAELPTSFRRVHGADKEYEVEE